jgi:hypothetical protein
VTDELPELGRAAVPVAVPIERRTSMLVARNPRCRPLLDLYESARATGAQSWNQIEAGFLDAMSAFDESVAATAGRTDMTDAEKSQLSADLQNGKGDFFNDLLALLLENCSGVDTLYIRNMVPGLIVRTHNLDGVYPAAGPIEFLLEAKMMGTPRHVNSPRQRPIGRPGSADLDKRVKELAFKSIDLKGEYSRLRTAEGRVTDTGGPAGGDLTTWLRSAYPKIYFFVAVRVVSDSDFVRTIQWAHTAQQVVDAVGVYCFEPDGSSATRYRRRAGVPADLELERIIYRACTNLRAIAERQRIG